MQTKITRSVTVSEKAKISQLLKSTYSTAQTNSHYQSNLRNSAHAQKHARSHVLVSKHMENPTVGRAKNCPRQHHYQPCNRTCQIGTLLLQLQH